MTETGFFTVTSETKPKIFTIGIQNQYRILVALI